MSQDRLGLFDTPPDRNEIRLSLVIVGLLFGALLIILPAREVRWGEVSAFVPVIDAVMFASELIIATLLYAQSQVFRSRALVVLATGYVFIALLLVPHALTFPGAFAPDGLLGAGTNTTAWIAFFRRLAFPIAVILYVQLKRVNAAARSGPERPAQSIISWVSAAFVLAAAVTILATIGQELLPPLFLNRADVIYSNLVVVNVATIMLTIVATLMLFRQNRSVLDMWLLVALSGWLFQSLLNLPLQARFTLGWYGLLGMMLVSNLVVMLALIAESNRLYARLALTTSQRNRERDSRLMSMDAVAAAISHEAGQPLTATTMNAMAGLKWLMQTRPNVEKAIAALRATIDDSRRTFDVIKSIREMFARGRGAVTEFDLNELIRETALKLDRELVGHKVLLEFALDEALPPVLADRIQIQRVLVNLLTNAIESLAATHGQNRSISIRSKPASGRRVLLEVSDTGIGVAPEAAARIFDAFVTTKETGTGLGLTLSRTIVEEHGGRLWASQGKECGATFHLQLPLGVPERTDQGWRSLMSDTNEETDLLLARLEEDLEWMREGCSGEVAGTIEELQRIVDGIRARA